jgi:serine/threonine protein kinase/formylglycine-generating enzyme required for sulfatase activity
MSEPENSAPTGPWQPAEGEAARADAVPQRIGRYRVMRLLGQGGFGLVYLAHDDQLQRPVAVKVPHRRLVARPEDADAYLAEARTVAALDHPHIVPVYDVGGTEDCPCFIVSKYVEGCTLAQRIRDDRRSVPESAELIATVAQALHYAHRKGLVHRDVKPSNILLDAAGEPHVADFGVALREENLGRGPKFAGTPAYMSPEQARGEGHRVDGRSDIFSLGVVFYELLVGRPPFRADSPAELLEQVTTHEPRPLRQIEEGIPKELERICFKALAKRSSERYMTAQDMADDLRHFLAERAVNQPSGPVAKVDGSPAPAGVSPPSTSVATSPSAMPSTPTSDSRPVKVVPKGLRSFDEHDADFFLDLLPGPRDRDGLPDSIRFWKIRIEEPDADKTFLVGLIYGPSGCGKSSLVKAGLLPRLSDKVLVVYVEAAANETEARLLNGLRKRCPTLPASLGLKETLVALRRGQGIPLGKKVLIVLDQFEQWLHARKEAENTELVHALRQCDGGRVQCVVMVRDDFWMAATRFMRELEVRLLEGQNSAAVDLFPVRHAQKVLAAFGRAFGVLPEDGTEATKGYKQFLEDAVRGLSQESKVICVRLALFAELMKGKQWTPAALKAVGGTEGVGVGFLEETFSVATAPPEHRYHQKAARGVLKALLPESGTDIKGHMRSYGELLEASGYASRPKDFDALLRILDGELRLLTPTDPEGKDEADQTRVPAGARYYQLTHDFLVPSLRDWLTRKQKETRRGRAELLLADRAAVWNARPEKRQLPTLWQWLTVLCWTRKKNWTPAERKMMRRASRYQARRGLAVTIVLAVVVLLVRESYGRIKAQALRDRLLECTTAEVPEVVKEMAAYRRWVDPLLREGFRKDDLRFEADDAEFEMGRGQVGVYEAQLNLAKKTLDRAQILRRENPNVQAQSSVDIYEAQVAVDQARLNLYQQAIPNRDARKLLQIALCKAELNLARKTLAQVQLTRQKNPSTYSQLQVDTFEAQVADAQARLDARRQGMPSQGSRKLLHVSLALVPVDPGQVEYLFGRLLRGEPQEVSVIRGALSDHRQDLAVRSWSILENPKNDQDRRLRAACALAAFAPDDPRWEKAGGDVAATLVIQKPFVVAQWADALKGVGHWLIPPLADFLTDEKRSVPERGLIATVYSTYAAGLPDTYARLEKQLAEKGSPDAPVDAKIALAKRQASVGVALLVMGRTEKVWPLLRHSPDPTVRSYLIDRAGPGGVDAKALIARLEEEKEVSARRAVLLSLGEFGLDGFGITERRNLLPRLLQLCRDDPDPGMHGAAEWLLRRWQAADQLKEIDKGLATGKAEGQRRWYINRQGQTMVVVAKPGEFWMGEGHERHRRQISRSFAIASKEVTVEQFLEFRKGHQYPKEAAPSSVCPANSVSWYDAAAYCNFLSEQEGLPKDEWCYLPNGAGKYEAGMKMAQDYLRRTGYRLPTEAEWEYACRAGAETGYSFGEPEDLLGKYAWYGGNSPSRSQPVGSLRPNDLGLFDMHGDVNEWVQDAYKAYVVTEKGKAAKDTEDKLNVHCNDNRVLRGGSFALQASLVRSARRLTFAPASRVVSIGFRPARTFTP